MLQDQLRLPKVLSSSLPGQHCKAAAGVRSRAAIEWEAERRFNAFSSASQMRSSGNLGYGALSHDRQTSGLLRAGESLKLDGASRHKQTNRRPDTASAAHSRGCLALGQSDTGS